MTHSLRSELPSPDAVPPGEDGDATTEPLRIAREQATVDLAALQTLALPELRQWAEQAGISVVPNLTRGELLHAILSHRLSDQSLGWAEGVLAILPEGYGFLRCARDHFEPGPQDVYVSPSQIRHLNLKPGHLIAGPVRPPRRGEKFFALLHVDRIDEGPVADLRGRIPFAARTPILPTGRLCLVHPGCSDLLAAMQELSPWGMGQRVLVHTPPGCGKTALLTDLALALRHNHRELRIVLCLLDERPEEATGIQRCLAHDPGTTTLISTFDQPTTRHLDLAELALARCQRMVESGHDVVLLLDSLTHLTRARHLEMPFSGRLLCPGLDAGALLLPKKLFGAARRCEEGGSLTVIATVATHTGSRIDEVIAESFANRGNAEVVLDHELVALRDQIPLDVAGTGTRREDQLLAQEQGQALQLWRTELLRLPKTARGAAWGPHLRVML